MFSDVRLEACAVEYYLGQLKHHGHITWLSYHSGSMSEITARGAGNLTRVVTARIEI